MTCLAGSSCDECGESPAEWTLGPLQIIPATRETLFTADQIAQLFAAFERVKYPPRIVEAKQ